MQSKPKRDVIAKDERSKTDKNRERRVKKILQKRKQKFQQEKERRRAERDPRFKERLERKQARENLKNSTNTKVLKTVRELLMLFCAFCARLYQSRILRSMSVSRDCSRFRSYPIEKSISTLHVFIHLFSVPVEVVTCQKHWPRS